MTDIDPDAADKAEPSRVAQIDAEAASLKEARKLAVIEAKFDDEKQAQQVREKLAETGDATAERSVETMPIGNAAYIRSIIERVKRWWWRGSRPE